MYCFSNVELIRPLLPRCCVARSVSVVLGVFQQVPWSGRHTEPAAADAATADARRLHVQLVGVNGASTATGAVPTDSGRGRRGRTRGDRAVLLVTGLRHA